MFVFFSTDLDKIECWEHHSDFFIGNFDSNNIILIETIVSDHLKRLIGNNLDQLDSFNA